MFCCFVCYKDVVDSICLCCDECMLCVACVVFDAGIEDGTANLKTAHCVLLRYARFVVMRERGRGPDAFNAVALVRSHKRRGR